MDSSTLDLRQLRYFIAVAEELHFSAAAKRLFVAQPALSQQIRRMEAQLGCRLFDRTSRAVALTPAGEVLLQRGRRTLRLLAGDLDEVRAVSRGETGSLNVGFIGSAMLTRFPEVIQGYRRSYPRVELRLHESFTSQVLRGLQEERLDAGLVRDSDAVDGIDREALFTEPFVAVVAARHRLARRSWIRASELHAEPFVFYSRSAGEHAYDKPLNLCAVDGFHPRVVQEASHWLTILRLIEAGLGVTVAPACVRRIAGPQVRCLPLAGTAMRSVVELAFRSGDRRPLVQQFATMARELASTVAKKSHPTIHGDVAPVRGGSAGHRRAGLRDGSRGSAGAVPQR